MVLYIILSDILTYVSTYIYNSFISLNSIIRYSVKEIRTGYKISVNAVVPNTWIFEIKAIT